MLKLDLNPAETALGHALPHRRNEAWKWTDLRGKTAASLAGLSVSFSPKIEAPEGVEITLGAADAGNLTDSPMGAIAKALSPDVLNIHVAKGVAVAEPVVITELSRGHSRMTLRLDAGASLTLVEHHRGQENAFVNIDLQIHLGKNAKLTRVVVQDDPESTLRVATARVVQHDDSQFNQFILSFGGALTRLETRLSIEGSNVSTVMNGAYLLDGKRHCDMTGHMQLVQPDNVIRQSVKGVIFDKARGVFQGKFHVERAAQHTDAEMRHDALLLSDTAEVRAKPELEIYADDVECAHGNTVGALDESALFYMRQRGIPLARAKALLIEAFLVGVFDDLENEELRESLADKIRGWLEAKL